MSDHAKLSPSKRDRWSACPGSVREEAKYPDISSASADDGTHSHTLLETCLKTGFYNASEYVGTTMKDHVGEFVVDAARAERVQIALDYVRSRLDTLTNAVVASERKVTPASAVGRKDMVGTADIQIGSLADGVYEIADLKDGINPVAADSKQLRLYGVAALAGLHTENFEKIHTVRLTIIQPKAALKGMEPVRFVEFKKNEFFGPEVAALIAEGAATDTPDAPLVPGEAQCKYCKHKGACAALLNQTMEQSGLSFENLEALKDRKPTELTDEQIADVVAKAPVLRKMLEGIEAEAQRRLESGRAVAGLKLVRGRGSRSWVLSEDEMVEKLKKFGLNKGDIIKESMISPPQAETAIKEMCKKKGVDPTKKLKTLSEEYIKTTDGKLTVCGVDDPRPAVSLDASPMFADVSALPDWLR